MSRKKKKAYPEYVCGEGLTVRVYDDKVVEARLEGIDTKYAFEHYLRNVLDENSAKFIMGCYYSDDTKLCDVYIGRAFVNTDKGDTFNYNTGKTLAIERCIDLYHKDFNDKIVKLLEALHTTEARIFNRLRKSKHLEIFERAKSVDEIYDTQFRMPGQKSFVDVLDSKES